MHFHAVWGDLDHAAMMRLRNLSSAGHVLRVDLGQWPTPRTGEVVGVFDLRAFGPKDRDWIVGLEKITKAGAGVVAIDRDTGERGEECWSAAGAKLFRASLENRMRKVSAKEMARRRWKEKAEGRMPDDEARMIWFDQTLTEETALKRMPGWTRATAMARLGGRRRGDEFERWAPVAAGDRAKRLALAKAGPAKEVRPARGPRWKKSKPAKRK